MSNKINLSIVKKGKNTLSILRITNGFFPLFVFYNDLVPRIRCARSRAIKTYDATYPKHQQRLYIPQYLHSFVTNSGSYLMLSSTFQLCKNFSNIKANTSIFRIFYLIPLLSNLHLQLIHHRLMQWTIYP